MNIQPLSTINYNRKYNNNRPENSTLQTPNFKAGAYDRLVENIAKNYYGKSMQSGFVKWLGKKTENLDTIRLCSSVNSLIISTMYVVKTLQNKKLDEDRRTTLAINDGLTFLASTALAYGVDNALGKKWGNVTHHYAATRLGMTKEELTQKFAETNERLFYENIRTDAIKKANALLPEGSKIPLEKDIEAIIKTADEALDKNTANSIMNEVNEAIKKANIGKTSQDAMISELPDTKKLLNNVYGLMNSQEKTSTLYTELNEILTKANQGLAKEKRIPLAQDIEAIIQKANTILETGKKIPMLDEIKAAIEKANGFLPKNAKIKPEQVIKNAEDYARDIIKNRDLNFKIKGMGIFKSLFVFGMIYRYVVPVFIMKPANKLGAKVNERHAKRVEAENQRIAKLQALEAQNKALKANAS